MEAHSNFSSNLFSRDDIGLEAQGYLFSLVTARLSKSEQTLCDGPLRRSNRNKSPSIDDLTVEFYAHLWDKLGEFLMNVFNQSLARGKLPESMKVSVTRLVRKKDDR